MTFGLITEGPTDQVVLRTILARYISPDVDVRAVQPQTDSTDRADHLGGWTRVFGYCASDNMLTALEANDFVIVQMDTDCCEEYGVQKRDGGRNITDEQIVTKTKEKVIENIGVELFARFEHKVIFAISHDSIECWLLPLYYTNNHKKKRFNCCDTLNQELIKRGFTLDCNNKSTYYYNRICKEIKNKVQLENISVHNISFNQFIQRLATINYSK